LLWGAACAFLATRMVLFHSISLKHGEKCHYEGGNAEVRERGKNGVGKCGGLPCVYDNDMAGKHPCR